MPTTKCASTMLSIASYKSSISTYAFYSDGHTGKFKPMPQGHQYSFIVIHMLTYYIWHIPLYTTEANEVSYFL